MEFIRKMHINYWLMILMAGLLTFGAAGCKSKKKIAEAQAAEEKARMIAKAKADLLAILNDDGSMTLDQKEAELDRIKALNIDDEEVQDLIGQVEAKLAQERAEEQARLERERARASKENVYSQLDNNFTRIANTNSVESANQLISQTMNMFASPDVPVLIIIYQQGEQKDYDKPTTIQKYLNYLKDQGKNPNAVENLVFNDNGKITEVELVKE